MTRPRLPSKLRPATAFTILEFLIIIAIIGVLASIAIPALLNFLQEARVRAIVGDYQAFRYAVHEYYVDNGEYPRDRRAGVVPPELEPYLKDRIFFGWRAAGLRYDWQNWWKNGRAKRSARRLGVLRGLSVRADARDHPLLLAIARHYDGELVVRRKFVTFIMEPYKDR